jgi:hypothetical protein
MVSEALIVRNQKRERWMKELSDASYRESSRFVVGFRETDFHLMVMNVLLICRNPSSTDLTRAIGCRLHGNWEIQDRALANSDVRAWLKLPSTPSSI